MLEDPFWRAVIFGVGFAIALIIALGPAMAQEPKKRWCDDNVMSMDRLIAFQEKEAINKPQYGKLHFKIESSENGLIALVFVTREKVNTIRLFYFYDDCLVDYSGVFKSQLPHLFPATLPI